MNASPDQPSRNTETEQAMAEADRANGEGSPDDGDDGDDAPANTVEAKYGDDESPA